jgi:hypothetical protein
MKNSFFLILLLFPILLTAQSKKDSTAFYERQLTELVRENTELLKNSEQYKLLEQKLYNYNKRKNNYNSFSLFGVYNKANLATFNTDIAASGFSAVKENFGGFGFGATTKRGKLIGDLQFLTFSFANKTVKSNTDEKISLRVTDIFQGQFGYALIDAKNIVVYPFAGAGLRANSMTYTRTQIVNPGSTNISTFIQSPGKIEAQSLKFTYQAGVNVDIIIKDNEKTGAVTIFFVKTGINRVIGDDTYTIDDYKFNPGITFTQWQLAAGIKLAMRKTFTGN